MFGGVAIVQLANQVMRAGEPTARQDTLSIVATAAAMFVFGMILGRLITRWRLRRLQALIDSDTGAIRARA